MDSIYTVTAVTSAHGHETHCIGWFLTYEDAEKATLEDKLDFSEEGHFEYAVIEKIQHAGAYPFSPSYEQKWFKVNVEKDESGNIKDITYKKMDSVPEEYIGVCNFSMG